LELKDFERRGKTAIRGGFSPRVQEPDRRKSGREDTMKKRGLRVFRLEKSIEGNLRNNDYQVQRESN